MNYPNRLITVLLLASSFFAGNAAAVPECRTGTYLSADGNVMVIRQQDERFTYTLLDGRRATVNGGIDCRNDMAGTMDMETAKGPWKQVAFTQTATRYEHDSVTFFGRLIEPAHASGDRPLAVLAHGSERSPWASGEGDEPWFPIVSLVAAQGVSVFIFDKRGTGASGGEFNMDFHRLAGDLVAAGSEAKRLARGRIDRFGLIGFSQGGWVASLAAQQLDPDFLVVAYGALYSPLDEAWEEIRYKLLQQGYGDETLAEAEKLLDAMAPVRASELHDGFERLEAAREKYRKEPWFEVIASRQDWAGELARTDIDELRGKAGENRLAIPWTHDGLDVTGTLEVPQLWILAEEDSVAPIRLNLERLETLQAQGRPIRIATFPDTDHGMVEFLQRDDTTREFLRFTDGYFRLLADSAKGVEGSYGKATLTHPDQ